MGILKKIFNPFSTKSAMESRKQNKFRDNKNKSKVPTRPPSDLLLYSRDIAGMQIQGVINELEGANWLRAAYTYPSFDDMNFIYKDNVFSVIIDIQDEEGFSYLPEEFIKRQLFAAKKFNLVPCKFPIVVKDPHNPDMNTVRALNKGVNLIHTETQDIIDLETIKSERTEVSDWEYRHYAIEYVMNYLTQQGMKVLSFQDTLEIDPQFWFEDNNNKQAWMIVRAQKIDKKDTPKPKALKEMIEKCFTKDGYYSLVSFTVDDVYKKRLYRGDKFKIALAEFEKVHSTL